MSGIESAHAESATSAGINRAYASEFVLTLSDAKCQDTELAGGKAANLSILVRNGVDVPEGFVLTTEAYDVITRDPYYYDLGIAYDMLSGTSYVSNGNTEGKEPSGQMLDILEEASRAANYFEDAIALRSSATVEDGSRTSLAGVFDTHYVNRESASTPGLVMNTILGIYKQAQSETTRRALIEHGINPDDLKMAIIIQRLVKAEYSGVMYTRASGDGRLVQYTQGMGDRLVDGVTTGTSIIIEPETGVITRSFDFESRAMPRENVKELERVASEVESVFGGTPQDVEFAIDERRSVKVVQSRPMTREVEGISQEITTLEAVDMIKARAEAVMQHEMSRLKTQNSILFQANFSELLPNPSPMDVGVFQYIFPGRDEVDGAIQIGRRDMGYPLKDGSTGYLHYIGGRAYESLAGDALTYFGGFPESEAEYVETLVAEYLRKVQEDPDLASYPEMGLYLQDPTLEDLQTRYGDRAPKLFDVYHQLRQKLKYSAEVFKDNFGQTGNIENEQFIESLSDQELDELDDDALLYSTVLILEHLRQKSCVDFVHAARLGFYYTQRLQSFLADTLGLAPDEMQETLATLGQGLEGSSVTETNIAISEADDLDTALAIARQRISHYPAIGEMLEIRHPRLSEDPDALRAYVEEIRINRDFRFKHEAQTKERRVAEQSLTEMLPLELQAEFREVAKNAQTYMALRETIKDQFGREYGLLRERLVEIESRLGIVPEGIFYLYPRELPEVMLDPSSYYHIIEARKAEFTAFQKVSMPTVITPSSISSIEVGVSNNRKLVEEKGRFLSHGTAVQGVVIKLDDYGELEDDPQHTRAALHQRIQELKGKGVKVILAARQVNLTDDPLINLADGLILQKAGIVSHGAQRARELGIGALSGIDISIIDSGMKIIFDPHNRMVRRIDE